MLDGKEGDGTRKAMELLTKMGDYFGAEKMVPISMAYITLGPDSYGVMIKYIKELVENGARFRTLTYVPTLAGSLGKKENDDLWIQIHKKMGGVFTEGGGFGEPDNATTYPVYGQNVLVDGTNVTSYCNGVIGARANNFDPIGQYAGAITGLLPKYGYLTREGRLGKNLVDVKITPRNRTDWSALGFYVSMTLGKKWWDVPVFRGLEGVQATSDELSSFCSSIPTYGPINHFLIVGISPEARSIEDAFGGNKQEEKIEVGNDEIKQVYDRFSSSADRPDFISLGGFGPYLPLKTAYKVASMLEGKKVKIPMQIALNKFTKAIADEVGITKKIEGAGVVVTQDNFSIVQNAKQRDFKVIAFDNAKACQYSGQQEVETVLLDDETLIKVALAGTFKVN